MLLGFPIAGWAVLTALRIAPDRAFAIAAAVVFGLEIVGVAGILAMTFFSRV
jgi:hypothetical protein